MHLAVNQEIKVRFFLSPQIPGSWFNWQNTSLQKKSYGFDSFGICIIGISSNGQEATLIR